MRSAVREIGFKAKSRWHVKPEFASRFGVPVVDIPVPKRVSPKPVETKPATQPLLMPATQALPVVSPATVTGVTRPREEQAVEGEPIAKKLQVQPTDAESAPSVAVAE